MAQERLVFPGTALQNQEPVKTSQSLFGGGQNSDDPGYSIGDNELAEILNLIPFGKFAKGRSGCALMAALQVPYIDEYDTDPSNLYFTCSKVGKRVYIHDSGRDYSDLVEGNYIQWSDGDQDQIRAITVPGTGDPYFDSVVDGDKAEDAACYQQARVWGIGWNQNIKKIVLHVGTKLYFTTNAFAAYTLIHPIGADEDLILADSRTRFAEDEDQIIAFNASGQFKIYFDSDSAYYFKMNSGQPTVRIFEDPALPEKEFIRNRIYTISKIVGPGSIFGDRETAGCTIQHESAPVLPDAAHKDASIGYTDKPIGIGGIVYQELVSGATANLDFTHYNIHNDASFNIEINGLGAQDIINDLSECDNMGDICAEIQRNLRDFFPGAECFIRNTAGTPEIVIISGKVDGGTVGYVSSAASGTDISSLLAMTGGGTPLGSINSVVANEPQLVLDLNTPEQKGTHFSIYESKDGGKTGIKLGNILDKLIWAKDIPIIKPMTVTIDGGKKMSVDGGAKLISKADKGSYLVCGNNGDVCRISHILSPTTGEESHNEIEAEATLETGSARTSQPVAIGAKKINRAYQIGNEVYLDRTMAEEFNAFDGANDIGKLLFVEDGTVRHIINVRQVGDWENYRCTVHESTEFGISGGTPEYLAVAWDPIMRIDSGDAGQDTKMVRFEKVADEPPCQINRISGSTFHSSDIDKKMLIVRDGVPAATVDILDVIDENTAEIDYAGGLSWLNLLGASVYGIILGKSGDEDWAPARFFNDFVSDDDLDARADDPAYLLQTRFFRPLPSSPIGAIGGSFMFVSEVDTNKISYSEMPATRKYIAGFYHPTWQADTNIKDTVTLLKYYQDRMVAFGKTSTWGSNISSFSAIKTPDIGEEIFTVPAFGIIDQVGLIHVDSLQDIGIGQSIILASDSDFALFDGRQFQRASIPQKKIRKIVSLWHTNVMSSYDPVGGYMIFGSPNVSSGVRNYVNMTEGKCFRLALLSIQGSGWCRYGGEAMVAPFPNTGGQKIENAYGMPIQIVLDELTGKWYQVNTYNGPTGSGLVETLVDKGDAEIVGSVKNRILQGNKTSIMLEHLKSKCRLSPNEPGGSFRTGFAITAKIYEAESIIYSDQAVEIPQDGDIAFDKRIDSVSIQNEFEFSTSGFILNNLETLYNTRDTAGSTPMASRVMKETGYQQEYSE